MRTLTQAEARRLAILGQGLGGPRLSSIPEVVQRLGRVQVDPTSIVERAERLTLWSRLGAYPREELRRLLEEVPRVLFEYNAFLVPVADLPLHLPTMRRYPSPTYTRGRYVAEWLRDNQAFRAYILDELGARGPLRARDLDDRADVPWRTGGWNDGKNLGRMLEILWLRGEIAIARREGSERVWDLFERVLPAAKELPEEAAIIEVMERQLLARGIARPGLGGALDIGRLPGRELGEESLRADGLAEPVAVEGLPGEWLAHRDLLGALDAGGWVPRTTLLGPFDPLIHDRERTLALWGFSYRFELYRPAAARQYGPYALAALYGDALVGRLDAALDRRRGVLEVRGVWAEPGAPGDAWAAVAASVEELAAWLGAGEVEWPSGPWPSSAVTPPRA